MVFTVRKLLSIGSMINYEAAGFSQAAAFEGAMDDLKIRCQEAENEISEIGVILQFQYACHTLPNPRKGIALSRYSPKNHMVGAYIEVVCDSISEKMNEKNVMGLIELHNRALFVIGKHMGKIDLPFSRRLERATIDVHRT